MIITVVLQALTASFNTDIDRSAKGAEKALKKMEAESRKSLKQFGTLIAGAATAAATGLALMVKNAIDSADELGKMSQKVGIAVEDLSKLAYAAKLSDVDLAGLQQGLVKLGDSAVEAQSGTGDAAAAFKALGISLKDAEGNLKSNYQLLLEVADATARYADGNGKAAALTDILGKSAAELIPFMNGGAAAIKEAGKELEQFGGVVTDKAAKAANEFNDNLTKLETASQSLALQVAQHLLPDLTALSQKFVDFSKDAKNAEEITSKLADGMKVLAAIVRSVSNIFEIAAQDMASLFGAILAAAQGDFKLALGILREGLADSEADVQDIADAWDEVFNGTRKAAAETVRFGQFLDDLNFTPIKPGLDYDPARDKSAKDAATKAATELEQVRKAQAAAAINLAKFEADQESDILDRANKDNLISFAEYYNRRADIQRAAIEQEIAQQQSLLGASGDDSERVSLMGEIALLKKQRDAIVSQTVAGIADSEKEIADSLRDIRADLLSAQGDEAGAAAIRLTAQYEDLLERLKAESNTAGIEIVNNLFNEKLVEAQLDAIQSEYSTFQATLAAQRDVIDAQQETGLLSERQARKEIIALQKAALPELKKLLDAQRQIAAATSDPQAHIALLQLEADYQRLANAGSETALRLKDAFEEGIIAALEDVGPKIETGIAAFDKFANSVIGALNRIAAEITAGAIADALFKKKSGSSGGGFLDTIFGVLGSFGGSGGTGSGPGGSTPTGFSAAGGPVFAGGSYVVGERGPELFTPGADGMITPNHQMGGFTQNLTINVAAPGGRISQESLEQLQTRVALATRRSARRNA